MKSVCTDKKRNFDNFRKKSYPVPTQLLAECENNIVLSLITCFKEKVESGWKFEGEYHDFWELVYVSEGIIYVSTEGRIQKIEKGNIVFFMPMEFHQMWCEDCPRAKFVVISFKTRDEFIAPLGTNIISLDTEKKEELAQIYSLINESFDVNLHVGLKSEITRNVVAEKICFNKLEYFLLSLLNEKKLEEQKHMSKGSTNYKLIIDTMHENITKNLTIEELASLCNLSVSNLKKTFRKYGNDGVMKYFNQLKINRAIRFLKGGYTAAQIAQQYGFSSQSYFSAVFKRETGMLPSEFKKKNM